MTASIPVKLIHFLLYMPLLWMRVFGTLQAVIVLAILGEWMLIFYGVIATGVAWHVFAFFGHGVTFRKDMDTEILKAIFRTGIPNFRIAVMMASTCAAVLFFFVEQADARSLMPALILSFSVVSWSVVSFNMLHFILYIFVQLAHLLAVIAMIFFGFSLTEAILLLSVVILAGAGLSQAGVDFHQREVHKYGRGESPDE